VNHPFDANCSCSRCDTEVEFEIHEDESSALSAAESSIFKHILRRLITCADNGYDTAELHNIVADARKAVGN
jgi:hypothetical protein